MSDPMDKPPPPSARSVERVLQALGMGPPPAKASSRRNVAGGHSPAYMRAAEDLGRAVRLLSRRVRRNVERLDMQTQTDLDNGLAEGELTEHGNDKSRKADPHGLALPSAAVQGWLELCAKVIGDTAQMQLNRDKLRLQIIKLNPKALDLAPDGTPALPDAELIVDCAVTLSDEEWERARALRAKRAALAPMASTGGPVKP